jgi:hypothetical protein
MAWQARAWRGETRRGKAGRVLAAEGRPIFQSLAEWAVTGSCGGTVLPSIAETRFEIGVGLGRRSAIGRPARHVGGIEVISRRRHIAPSGAEMQGAPIAITGRAGRP